MLSAKCLLSLFLRIFNPCSNRSSEASIEHFYLENIFLKGSENSCEKLTKQPIFNIVEDRLHNY